jgi:ubiquinone/menaquinone biosynthesis C-methylase UbiE
MQINKKNYWVQLPYLDKILKLILLKNRINIFNIFLENVKFNKNSKILDVGTTPILEPHENIIFYQYKWKNNITGFSNQDCNILKKKFKTNKFIKGDAKNINLKKNKFDISFCSATIEHVGSYKNQKKLISELYRISRNYVFLTTPNRSFPIDFHTKLPIIHLLPKKIHRKILKFFKLNYFASEKNLNLLFSKDIARICSDLKIIDYKIVYNKFIFLKSNIILIIKK